MKYLRTLKFTDAFALCCAPYCAFCQVTRDQKGLCRWPGAVPALILHTEMQFFHTMLQGPAFLALERIDTVKPEIKFRSIDRHQVGLRILTMIKRGGQ